MRTGTSVALLVLCFACPGHARELHFFEAVEAHMGTLMRIQLYAPDAAAARTAFRAAFDRIAVLDTELSDYQPTSELSALSRNAVRRPVRVSSDLYRVLDAAQHISEDTGGAFDITLGPLTHLWRGARKSGHPPDALDIQQALQRCGYRKLHLNPEDHTAMLDLPDMQLDAGAIAKGFAADEALAVIDKLGIHSALVAASGDLAFSNAPPGAAGWKIGIGGGAFVVRSNGAVSTSGASEQHLDAGATRYSHILDPRTGLGLTHALTVTVTGRHGLRTDAASTAISVLGAQRGLAWVERQPDLAARMTEGDGPARASSCFGEVQRSMP